MKSLKIYFSLFIGLILGLNIQAQLPDDFSDQLVSRDFDLPIGMAFDENGMTYIWEKSGKVFILDTSGNKIVQPLIDISEEVCNWRDHGLLGFALDPDFLVNGYYYLLYAVDRHYLEFFGTPTYSPDSTATARATIGRVTRYTADSGTNFQTTLPGSRKILLGETKSTGIPQMHESHGVGTLLFGQDGTLLVSSGDGGTNHGGDVGGDGKGTYATDGLDFGIIEPDQDVGSLRSLYLGSYNGKILRIDPETGDGIPSNPFYDGANPRSPQSRIWSLGFRNPFRIILDENTGSHNPEDGNPGRLLVGDVGGGRWEELDIVTEGGQNFGWPYIEGYEGNWEFFGERTANQLAPNPLYQINGCDQEYFLFRDLFIPERADRNHLFPNPCNDFQPIPDDAFPLMETAPVIVWSHHEWNLPTRTFIKTYNADGKIESLSVDNPTSSVNSEIFDGNSSMAGTFYRGEQFPAQYKNAYFHIDFSGWIKVFYFDENNQLEKIEPFTDNTKSNQIIFLAEHPKDGCLYYMTINGGGTIRKICFGGNPPPEAIATASTNYGPSPLTVDFDASQSFDPFDLPITYHWDFGDGVNSTEMNPEHVFTSDNNEPRQFDVVLTVTDSLGESAQTNLTISVNNTPPSINIVYPVDNSFYPMSTNSVYQLSADVLDAEHNTDQLKYEWQIFLHHNTHFHPEKPMKEVSPKVVITPIGCESQATHWYRIKLSVTDAHGLQSIKEHNIYPFCDPPFFVIQNFKGEAGAKDIDLSWDLVQDDGVDRFEVQSSATFETLGTVEANGIDTYYFTDPNPINGLNRYHLKVVRDDGFFDYTETITIEYPRIPDINVFPNPTASLINIKIKEASSEQIGFEMYDAAGKQILTTIWVTTPGSTLEQSIITQDLPTGLYFYTIRQNDEVSEGKVLVRH